MSLIAEILKLVSLKQVREMRGMSGNRELAARGRRPLRRRVRTPKQGDWCKLNRPGMSGDSSCWEGWSHVRWFVEEVPAGAA
jgi:hypothetical protein